MSLRKKIILLIVPIIVAPMIISGWVSYSQLKATTIEKSQEQMETLLEQYALYMDSLIHDSESNVRLFSNNEMLRRYMVTPSEEERYEILQPLLMKQFQNYQKAYPDYYEFRLIFPDGFEDLRLVNRPIDNLTMEESETPLIKKILEHKQGTHSRIMRNPDNNKLALYIATALSLKDRAIESNSSIPRFRGYLVLTIDVSEVIQQMELSKLGSDGFIFIANNHGIAELFSDRFESELKGEAVSRRQLEQLDVQNAAIDIVVGGLDLSQAPIIETIFLGGQGYMKAVKIHDNLVLIAWLPSTEIIDKTRQLAVVVIGMTLLTIAITILLLFSSLNYFVLRPIHKLRNAATEIGEGELSKALSMKQHDELGELAYSFDEMRKSMLSSREHLEKLVDERTSEVRQALKVAEKSSQEKSNFLSRMSHELRTPLNAILGFSQLFEYDRNLTEHQKTNVGEINDAGGHLLELINEVLDLSRIESGSLQLSLQSVSLAKVLSNCCVMTEPLARANEVTIKFDQADCDDFFVMADYVRIKQVVLNLLSNAVKYNQEHGRVELYCTRSANNLIRINVRDTGPGISENNMTQLFEPFNRLGAEYSNTEGTGIGLVITQQLIELMGGRLGVESKPGLGSTFWVELAASAASESSSGIEYQDEIGQQNHLDLIANDTVSILVAEDNRTNQEVLRQQLSLLGYTADFASDGVEAFERWQSGNYTLLLTDIQMPKMNGFELVKNIRNTKKYKDSSMKIMAITADAMHGQAQKCIEAGMDDYIAKPVHMDELKQKLNKCLSMAQANNEKDFSVRTNAVDKVAADDVSHQQQETVAGSNGYASILVAEDNRGVRELLDQQLSLLGYEADFAVDGEDAFERWQSGNYALLLTDINMPKMNGYELVKSIRKTSQYTDSSMKIIAISADAIDSLAKGCEEAGMDDYIAKPASIAMIKRKLEKWMPDQSTDEAIQSDSTEHLNDEVQQSDDAPISIVVLKEMVGDDPEVLQRLLQRFVSSSSESVEMIKQALSRKDEDVLLIYAHKLKGGARSMAANKLGDFCQSLEAAVKKQQWEEVEGLVSTVAQLFQNVECFVEEFCSA